MYWYSVSAEEFPTKGSSFNGWLHHYGLNALEQPANRAGARFVSETFELTNLWRCAMARPRFRRYFRHGLLPQLIAFEACLRLGGVTRAAEELALAQPTVSGLLRRLSDTIGEPVLQTKGGRVEATAAGGDVALLC